MEDINKFKILLQDDKTHLLYRCIFDSNGVNYNKLNELIPLLDIDDISVILKYDKDYSITFLLSIANKAYEDDLLKQAIYLIKRHGIKYIVPLLDYIDIDDIKENI